MVVSASCIVAVVWVFRQILTLTVPIYFVRPSVRVNCVPDNHVKDKTLEKIARSICNYICQHKNTKKEKNKAYSRQSICKNTGKTVIYMYPVRYLYGLLKKFN